METFRVDSQYRPAIKPVHTWHEPIKLGSNCSNSPFLNGLDSKVVKIVRQGQIWPHSTAFFQFLSCRVICSVYFEFAVHEGTSQKYN